ncbi:hypothetical protein LZ30DRAFT_194749 [Colletotrichum cereale]|nr:hypothetical protein LZ30DRAFT_194749 [Colletotrichum cereale]
MGATSRHGFPLVERERRDLGESEQEATTRTAPSMLSAGVVTCFLFSSHALPMKSASLCFASSSSSSSILFSCKIPQHTRRLDKGSPRPPLLVNGPSVYCCPRRLPKPSRSKGPLKSYFTRITPTLGRKLPPLPACRHPAGARYSLQSASFRPASHPISMRGMWHMQKNKGCTTTWRPPPADPDLTREGLDFRPCPLSCPPTWRRLFPR